MDWRFYALFAVLNLGSFFLWPSTAAAQVGMIERRNSSEFYKDFALFSKRRIFVLFLGFIAPLSPLIFGPGVLALLVSAAPVAVLCALDFTGLVRLAQAR